VGGLALSHKRKDDPCHWQWFGVAHLKQDSMRTFMAQKKLFSHIDCKWLQLAFETPVSAAWCRKRKWRQHKLLR